MDPEEFSYRMNVATVISVVLAAVLGAAIASAQTPLPSVPAPVPLPSDEVSTSTSSEPAPEGPYAAIVARNMFGLVPIPPPDPNAGQPPVDPPPKITLTGIMTIFGREQAIFTAVSEKPRAGQTSKESSYILAEGEREDDFEVVKILREVGVVRFNNHGVSQEILLMVNKEKDAAGQLGPGNAKGERVPSTWRGEPDRLTRRGPGKGTNAASQDANGSPRPPGVKGANLNADGSGSRTGTNIEDQIMAVARQMSLIEAQRKALKETGDSRAGLLPPTVPTAPTAPDGQGSP